MRKTPFLHEFVRKRKLPREAHGAEHLGLSGKDAGEQKESFEQLLIVLEGDGQEAGLKRNPVGEFHERASDQEGRS